MENSVNILKESINTCRSKLWIIVFFSFFINLLMFVVPLHMLQIYDRVLTSRSEVTLIALTGLAIGLLSVYGLLEGVRTRIMSKISLKAVIKVAITVRLQQPPPIQLQANINHKFQKQSY